MKDPEIQFYGTRWCWDSLRAIKVLKRQGVSYHWIDIDQDVEGCDFVKQVNNGMKSVPTIVFPDGEVLVEPSKMELADKLSDIKEGD
jgi:mycoredoxin